ncbi:MAG: M50 family metallopeptidase [Paracoccaceae bacterium]
MTYIKGHWQLLVITVIVYALLNTPALYPLRILTVFFHEVSHALAALITGGSVESLTLSPEEGGLASLRGGNLFLIYSAGYIGSLLIGTAFFLIALRTNLDRAAVALLGVCTLVMAAVFVRDSFPLLFCALTGGFMLLTAWLLPVVVNDMLLRVVGLTSMLYVPNDIISDTITRSHLHSDARLLAEQFGGATILWGGLWLLISLAVIALTLRYGLGSNSNMFLRAKTPPLAPPGNVTGTRPPGRA